MDSPGDLRLEGSKIRSDDLVTTLHEVMTSRPFPREPAHRVLIVFSPDDKVRYRVLTGRYGEISDPGRRVTGHKVKLKLASKRCA